jgi:ribose-phosphate pyrophosphokinase
MKNVVCGLSNSGGMHKSIAKKAGMNPIIIKSEKFPDNEWHLRFMKSVRGKNVWFVQSLSVQPNDALIELVFASRTAKELGAKKVNAIIPYLGYMRQDKRFKEGECVSARQMAWLLNNSIDRLITVDPHLHRIHRLNEIFKIPAKRVTANSEIAKHIGKKFSAKNTLIVGPDIESYQWARTIADSIGFESAIFLKQRSSARKVKVKVTKELEWKGKNVVIVDDIISTGHTMIEAVKEIRKRKAKAVHCICVHGILAENALEKLKKAGAKSVASCNTIPGKTNKIDVSGVIAKEIKKK